MTISKEVLSQYKRGGAGFTYAEWSALSADDQAAAIEAQDDAERRRAAMIAYYMLNPKALFETLGDGDALVRAVLEGMVR